MSIYTRTGDSGMTSLMKEKNISKSDDRIQLLGTIDELTKMCIRDSNNNYYYCD